MKCKRCGQNLSDGEKFCPSCGEEVGAVLKARFCSKCGKRLEEGASTCSSCGENVLSNLGQLDVPQQQKKLDNYLKLSKISMIGVVFGGFLPLGGIVCCVALVLVVVFRVLARNAAVRLDSLYYDDAMLNPASFNFEEFDADKYEKTLKNYYSKRKIFDIFACITIVVMLMLFFIRFFSLILTEVSIFQLWKESYQVLLGDHRGEETSSIASEIMSMGVLRKLYEISKVRKRKNDFFFFMSLVLHVFFMGVLFREAIVDFIRSYRLNYNENYKKAAVFSYARAINKQKKRKSNNIGAIVVVIVLLPIIVVMCFPFIDFLFALPKYFIESFTNSSYYIVLIAYLVCLIFAAIKLCVDLLDKDSTSVIQTFMFGFRE